MARSSPRKCWRHSSRRACEVAERFVRIGEYLPPHKALPLDLPDPGDRHVADAELTGANEDAAEDEQTIVVPLDPSRGDQQLFPEPFNVFQILAQPLRSDVRDTSAH